MGTVSTELRNMDKAKGIRKQGSETSMALGNKGNATGRKKIIVVFKGTVGRKKKR